MKGSRKGFQEGKVDSVDQDDGNGRIGESGGMTGAGLSDGGAGGADSEKLEPLSHAIQWVRTCAVHVFQPASAQVMDVADEKAEEFVKGTVARACGSTIPAASQKLSK